MMRRILTLIVLGSVLAVGGCSSDAGDTDSGGDKGQTASSSRSGKGWWSVAVGAARDALGWSVEVVHDGTGWLLGKAKVNIEQVGETRSTDSGYEADFRITVTSGDETFSSEVENVPCNEFGIPIDDEQDKFNEAVEQIKQMLDDLQD